MDHAAVVALPPKPEPVRVIAAGVAEEHTVFGPPAVAVGPGLTLIVRVALTGPQGPAGSSVVRVNVTVPVKPAAGV
jgi:hypothetical protein